MVKITIFFSDFHGLGAPSGSTTDKLTPVTLSSCVLTFPLCFWSTCSLCMIDRQTETRHGSYLRYTLATANCTTRIASVTRSNDGNKGLPTVVFAANQLCMWNRRITELFKSELIIITPSQANWSIIRDHRCGPNSLHRRRVRFRIGPTCTIDYVYTSKLKTKFAKDKSLTINSGSAYVMSVQNKHIIILHFQQLREKINNFTGHRVYTLTVQFLTAWRIANFRWCVICC